MLSNLLILPMLLPFLCALILVFLKNNDRISKYLYLGTMTITTIISLMLLIYVQRHRPITLDFGGWSAPLVYSFRRFFKFNYGYNRFVCDYFNYGIRIWAWRT